MDVGSIPDGTTHGGSVRSETAPSSGAGSRGRQTLMIAYDGSPNADRAISYAGRFLSADVAHVVTAWEPGSVSTARMSTLAAGMQPYTDTRLETDVDEALAREAAETNARGVDLARSVGLDATGTLVEVETTVWGALVAAADSLAVDMLVTGTRGETGFKALLHSSVAEHVLKHCHRPVFIVPAQCDQAQPQQPPVTP